jgi:phospholipid/cholesterol/gamma-HCH transport system ATP-binding protein
MDQSATAAMESEAMISLRNLRVSYGEREILHGISFDVKRGETLVILGGSGSGKSTLLRTLVGLEKPSSGEIWLKGKNLAAISPAELDEIRKKIGMSFQGGALFGSMTVGENVALPLREHTRLEEPTIEIILRLKLDQVGMLQGGCGHGFGAEALDRLRGRVRAEQEQLQVRQDLLDHCRGRG